MCTQINQLCTYSTKTVIYWGGILSLTSALALGYISSSTNSLFTEVSSEVAASFSFSYPLQLAAAAYLTLMSVFCCITAYYDHKNFVRALALVSTLNFILALVAVIMLPSSKEIGQLFEPTLKQAALKYNFTDRSPIERKLGLDPNEAAVLNSTAGKIIKRAATDEPGKVAAAPVVAELNATMATRIWDRLQARGCCGIVNGTEEWKSRLPKSCCSKPKLEGEEERCKEIDPFHQRGCLDIFFFANLSLILLLATAAFINFQLAVVTGYSAYRTFHYDEASQNAYS